MAMDRLQQAAKKSKFLKFILGGLLFLAFGGMVFTDVTGRLRGGIGQDVIAHVGDTKIHLREFDSQFKNAIRQTGLDPQQAYESGLVNAFLDGQINRILQMQAAQDLDLVMDNKTIAKQVSAVFGNMSKSQIEASLKAQGMTEQELAASLRANISSQIMQTLPMAVAGYVPNYVLEANLKIMAQQRSGQIYTLPLKNFMDGMTITEDDIQDYYQGHLADFTVAEEREFSIGTMTIDMAAKNLPAITDNDLKAEYDANLKDYTIAESRMVAQAIVKNPDDAQAIYESALKTKDLKAALIDITGKNKGYLAPATYQKSGLPQDLADAAFGDNIKKGDITPPVKTLVGYAILQITDIKPQYVESFNDVKNELKAEMSKNQRYDALYDKMMASEELIDSGRDFTTIATETKLMTSTTQSLTKDQASAITKGDLKEILTASPAILDELYTLPEGKSAYPLELDDNRYAIIGVKHIKPQTILPLADVHADIKKRVEEEKLQAEASSKLGQLVTALNNGTQSIDDTILKQAKQTSFKNAKHGDEAKLMTSIFATSKGQYAYEIDGDVAKIVVVNDISYKAEGEKAQEVATLIQAQRTMIDSLLGQYYRDKTDIAINQDLLKRTYSADSSL